MAGSPYHPRSSLKRNARNCDLDHLVPFPNFFIYKEEMPIICKCIFDGTDFIVNNTRDISTLYHNGSFGVSRVTHRDPLADQRRNYKSQPYFTKAAFLASDQLTVQTNFKVPICDIGQHTVYAAAETDKTSPETVKSNVDHNRTETSQDNVNNAPKVPQSNSPSSIPPLKRKFRSTQDDEKEDDELILMAEEVIFLTFGVGCLSVQDKDGKALSYEVIWNMMVNKNPEFPILYAVYHYFRCKSWVPKKGHSFGGDYLLYEYGPKFSHSTYVVHITSPSRPTPTWMELYARQRCANHFSKLALLCSVTTPKNFVPSSPMSIFQLNIQETTIRRWKPSN